MTPAPPTSRVAFLKKWGRLGAGAGAGQLVVQATAFLSGLVIIRLLPQEEYAFYTLANTMLFTMGMLADGGIASGVTALGGEVWQSRTELGKVLATGIRLRNRFALACLVVVMPITFYLYTKRDISTAGILIILAALIPTFVTTLSSGLYKVIPQLHQHIRPLVRVNVLGNVTRLATTVGALLLLPYAAVAMLCSGIAQFQVNRQLKSLMATDADASATWDPAIQSKILGFTKRSLPTSIYYALSGQITVWLLSIFGTTGSIAEVGALSRLMVVFTLVSMTVDLLVAPRFARLPKGSPAVVLRFLQACAVGVAVGGAVVLTVWLIPDVLLLVLGSQYDDLQYELLLISISSTLWMITNLVSKLAASRGILPNPVGFIASQILVQTLFIAFVVDYTSLTGVLYLSIATVVATLAYRLIHFLLSVGPGKRAAEVA